jgi:hypothetical protein
MAVRNKAALQEARKLREEFQTGKDEYTQEEYRDELAVRLEPFRRRAYDDFVNHIAEQVDKEATNDDFGDGQPCFPGWDVEGETRLGDGKRVPKRKTLINHADEMLAIAARNLASVSLAYARKHGEVERLRPYWPPGVTKEAAIAACQRANPGQY